MQAADIATLPEKPYTYQGLTVQGVSPYRLTPRPNENIEVPDEVGYAITARLLVRKLIEPRTAIAMVGLGVQPAALTAKAHVRAKITTAGLARMVANIRAREANTAKTDQTQKPAHPSEKMAVAEKIMERYSSALDALSDVDPSWRDLSDTNEDMDVEF